MSRGERDELLIPPFFYFINLSNVIGNRALRTKVSANFKVLQPNPKKRNARQTLRKNKRADEKSAHLFLPDHSQPHRNPTTISERHFYLSLTPMKFFCSIFSFYVLMLAVVPCADAEEINTAFEQSTVQHSQQNSQGHNEENNCSPLCTCACCGCSGFNIPVFYCIKKISEFKTEKSFPVYSTSFASDFISSIWQPPKI